MPANLRKRKAPSPAPAAATQAAKQAKNPSTMQKLTSKVKKAVTSKAGNGAASSPRGTASVGSTIELAGFGGEIQTHDGVSTTLEELVQTSRAGVVLFTYPKASTPGCTKQACLFRDDYTALSATGFAIYGLSADSPKSNTTFKTRQNLPYALLCDPKQTLISAIGLRKGPGSTQRGVFVVDRDGGVLAAEAGSPGGTVEVVRRLVERGNGVVSEKGVDAEEDTGAASTEREGVVGEETKAGSADGAGVREAEVAAEVADTAEKIDSKE